MKRKDRLLIIFYRNPVLGKVKTRLASTTGDAVALAVYLRLVSHTRAITESLTCDKNVCYTDFVDREDGWPNARFLKSMQRGGDLGERMMNAFRDGFDNGYKSICIIGTDCFELTEAAIRQAFAQLSRHDAVIGPAMDGGYYLLGMRSLYAGVFENKLWSSQGVAEATIADFRRENVRYFTLPLLRDVDEEKDLPEALRSLL